MIENVKFCHNNSNKFVITQFNCRILLYDLYQVSKYKFIFNVYCVYLYFLFVLQKDPQNIIFNSKLITGLCCSLNNEFIVYIGEKNGELSKIHLINGKTDSIKKISSCNLTLMNINPKRFVFLLL